MLTLIKQNHFILRIYKFYNTLVSQKILQTTAAHNLLKLSNRPGRNMNLLNLILNLKNKRVLKKANTKQRLKLMNKKLSLMRKHLLKTHIEIQSWEEFWFLVKRQKFNSRKTKKKLTCPKLIKLWKIFMQLKEPLAYS